MASLDRLLERPGMQAEARLLVAAQGAVWPGDQELFAECVAAGRELGMRRQAFEETLLQAVLFCGFPRVINASRVLHEDWPPAAPPAGGGLPIEQQRAAGEALFASIYGDNSDAVKGMLLSYHRELHDFVLDTAYGRILTRPGLEPSVRELMAVGVLALTGQIPQMVAHGRGARNWGATAEELQETVYTTTRSDALATTFTKKILRLR
jgi:AhpD family alkylhydroperoxidase